MTPELDPTQAAQEVLDAVQNGNWWIAAAIVLRFVVVYGRPLLAARVPFFATKGGGLLFVVGLSAVGGVLTALEAGIPLTSALLIGTVVKVAAGAVLTHKTIDAVKPPDPKAVAAEAAAKVTTPESAAQAMGELK